MTDKIFTIDHVRLLLYKLKEIQYQAEEFGITLGLKYNADIQAVCRQSHKAPHKCLQQVFSLWLQQPSQQRTWEILVKALRRDGEHVIANTIERKYTLDQSVSVPLHDLLGLVDGINTTNWRSVGLNLGLTLSRINEIDDKGGWSQYVMIQLLSLWLRGSGKPATLDTLVTAVRELQNFDLAERLAADSELHLSDSAPIIQDDILKDVTDGVIQTSNDTSKSSIITDNQPLAVTTTKTDDYVSNSSVLTDIPPLTGKCDQIATFVPALVLNNIPPLTGKCDQVATFVPALVLNDIPPLTDAVCHVFYKPTMIKNKWIVIIAVIKPHPLEDIISQFGGCVPGQKLKTKLIESTLTLELPANSWLPDWSVEYPTPTQLLQTDVLLGKICCFQMTVSSELNAPLPLDMDITLKGAQPPNIVTVQRMAEVVLRPEVLEQWISEGFVDLHITKLNIHGAPKTGKTSSLHLLLGEPPPPNYNSTDIARAAVTAVRISVENDRIPERWIRADHVKTFEQFVQRTKLEATTHVSTLQFSSDCDVSTQQSSSDVSTPQASIDVSTPQPSIDVSTPQSSSDISTPQSSSGVSTTQPSSGVSTLQPQSTSVVSSKQQSTNKLQPIFGAHWIYSVDSGGQPAFLDLLPLFVQSGSINLIALRLSQELKNRPKFKYSVNGKEVCLPQPLRFTNQELVELFLRSLSFVTPIPIDGIIDAPPDSHFLILGTYSDKARKCRETPKRKNEILGQALKEYNEVIISNDNDVIFDVNTQMPMGEEREKKASHLRRAIATTPGLNVKMPKRFFAFELEIHKLSEERKQDIILLEDCYKIGKGLGMSEDDVRVALQFLHFVSVIFYFPLFLPKVIFVNPQPLIGLLSKLVSAGFVKISEVFGTYLTKKEATQLQQEGIFSKDLLYRLSSSSFIPKVFTIDHYIQLLKHLLVITPINDTTYFIPCVLSTVPLTEKQKRSFLREGDADPFAIMWEKKGIHDEIAPIPLGLFPATVAAILTHSNNHRFVLPKPTDDFPHQLRNAVRLKCDTLGGFLLLVDNHKWLELYYHGDRNDCPVIRDVVERATVTAQSNLKYDTERVSIRYGFLCSLCQSNRYNRDHPSKANHRRRFLMCSNTNENRPMSQLEECWFADLSGPEFQNAAFDDSQGLKKPQQMILDLIKLDDLRVIIDKMRKDHITRSQWRKFGHLLGIRTSALHHIETNNRGDEDSILFHVLMDWIQGNGRREPTWDNLVKALDGIGARRAAEEILDQSTTVTNILVDDKPLTVDDDDLDMIVTILRGPYSFSTSWIDLGDLLGIRHRFIGNAQTMLYDMLIEWIRGRGSIEPTWRNLIDALYKIDEDNVADKILTYFNFKKQQ